jgi:phage/plasmid-like protein (TIGR03299 family)
MSAEVETMAYVGATPWHGLGNKLEQGASIEEMTKAAGLDWAVSQHPMFVKIGDEEVAVPNKVAVTRDTDKRILSVSSTGWKPFQNAELMEFFRDFVDAGSATLETAGSLYDGKTIWALANINKGFTLKGRDTVNGYVLLSNSHAPGSSIRAMTTMVRVVCQNTLTMANARGGATEYRQNHMKDFDMSKAKETFAFARESVAVHKMEAEALSSLQMSAYDTVRTLATFFQPDMAEHASDVKMLLVNPDAQSPVLAEVLHSVVSAPGAIPENAWGLLNGVTHYADHVAGRSPAARLTNSTFGQLAKVKLDVKDYLLQMAGYTGELV